MAQRWEHSPPNNVARVQIPVSTPYYVGVEFVVGSLPCSERFSLNTPAFPCLKKTTFLNSNSTRNRIDKEPLCGCATSKSLYIFIIIFICSSTDLDSISTALWVIPEKSLIEGEARAEQRGRTAPDNRAYLWSTVKIELWTLFSDQWLLSDVVNICTTRDSREFAFEQVNSFN